MKASGLNEELIAMRAAQELKEGYYVNLGFGLPGIVQNFIPAGMQVVLHAENGILGYGPIPDEELWDADLVSAATAGPTSLLPGVCFFDQAIAMAMMRGKHLDVAFLGAYQVSQEGDLANWMRQAKGGGLGAIGGGMDLAYGAKKVIVLMNHVDRSGKPRIVKHCSYPLTAKKAVSKIITNLAVIEITPEGLLLTETAPGFTAQEIQAVTEPKLAIASYLKEMVF